MNTCSIPDCNEPHHAKGLCSTHYKAKQRRDIKRDKYGTPTVPKAREYISKLTIGQHNIGVYFIIESVEYHFDTKIDWKPVTGPKGPIGKYSHAFIRDALGYPYDPTTMKGQKPPLSVIKGRYSNKIEVFINEGAKIDSDKKLANLLARMKAILEADLHADLSGPYAKEFKATGEDITDYTVPCPLAKKFGQDHPDEIPFKAPREEGDKYENARIDGSHPTAFEMNSRQQAEDMRFMLKDAGVRNPGDIQQAVLVSKYVNTLEGFKNKTSQRFDEVTIEVQSLKEGTIGTQRALEGLIESNIRTRQLQEDLAMRPEMVQPVYDQSRLLELKQEISVEKTKREVLEERLKELEGKSRWDVLREYLKGGKR